MFSSLAPPHAGHAGTDRCPGALTVHQAQDGGLVRIRIPGGAVRARVFAAIGEWSSELGNGRMELTGRGNLQLRGLRPGAEDELATRLAEHDLLPSPAYDKARNVLASPLSGRDGLGAVDVRPLVGELDRGLCGAGELVALPGRFLFALDDGRGDVAAIKADATVVGLTGQRVALLIGGQDSGLRLPMSAAVSALLAVARAFLRRRADHRVWRVTELPDGPLSLVPDVESALGCTLLTHCGPTHLDVPEALGPVGRIEQTDGRAALAVHVPLGELTPDRCRLLAELAEHEVVITPWRSVVLPDLSHPAVEPAARRLTAAGLVLDPAAPVRWVSACTGRPGCASALADVRTDALPPASAADLPRLATHWSGCARRCGRPTGHVLDVVAEEDGYQVYRDDEPLFSGSDAAAVRAVVARAASVPNASLPAASVPAASVPATSVPAASVPAAGVRAAGAGESR